jgi:alpha-glucoside transport system permease protein
MTGHPPADPVLDQAQAMGVPVMPARLRFRRRPRRLKASGPWPRLAMLLIGVVWMIPTIGLLVSSFRDRQSALTSGWWTVVVPPFDPGQWTLDNYSRVIFDEGMGNAFLNTLVVAIPSTLIPVTIAAFAGYGFAWTKFRAKNVLFVLVIGLMIIPLQIAFIPLLRMYSAVGIQGTFLTVWLAHTGFSLPIAIYLMRNYMGGLPRELLESATVDGATEFQTFMRVVVPLSVPVLAAYGIFQFLWVWNDYLIALIFLGTTPGVEVATINLAEMIGTRGQDWNLLTAGAFVTMIVPLLVFFTLQRYFVRGLTGGSVKG